MLMYLIGLIVLAPESIPVGTNTLGNTRMANGTDKAPIPLPKVRKNNLPNGQGIQTFADGRVKSA